MLVAFRGSAQLADWISNLKINSVPTQFGSIHRGFFQSFHDVRQSLENLIEPLLATRSLLLTGHSLGGALAVLAAMYWSEKFKIGSVYTFGQPRVGLPSYQAYMRNHAIDRKIHRIVNANDIVPRVPPRYAHAGHHYRFDESGT